MVFIVFFLTQRPKSIIGITTEFSYICCIQVLSINAAFFKIYFNSPDNHPSINGDWQSRRTKRL